MPQVAPVIAGIAAAVGSAASAAAAAIGSSAILQGLLQVGLGLGLTLLQRALFAPELDQQTRDGVRTKVTTSGGTIPQGFVLGRYMTAGHHVCPPMSYNPDNNALVYVIELSEIAGISLTRIMVDGKYSGFEDDDPSAPPNATRGATLPGLQDSEGQNYGWIRFHDGHQTEADQFLVANFATYERPWTTDHIGTGIAYAVVSFRFDREVFSGLPSVQFEVEGIPLYDPRLDTTAGGSGAHRFDDVSTWEPSRNPVVMIYNVMRGIPLLGGAVYGGGVAAEDLPFDNWTAAMNVCDQVVGPIDNQRPRYEAGLEVRVNDEPARVIEELLKACSGQLAEQGGVWRIQTGAPGTSVYAFTDADIVIDEDEVFDQAPGLLSIHNAVTATYVEPRKLWEGREAPPLYDSDLEAEDGGRRLVANLTLPTVFDVRQAKQLMRGYLRDGRRFRVLTLTLPPDAWPIEPLDTVSWTSERNGWTDKLFEVVSITDDPLTLLQTVTLRERDPSDYDWTADDEPSQPVEDAGAVVPAAQSVVSWGVAATAISDGTVDRRPALALSWDPAGAADVELVRWQVRRFGTQDVIAAGVTDIDDGGVVVSGGILPLTEYEARGRYVASRPTLWTSWVAATTADVRLVSADIDSAITAAITAAQDAADAAQADADAVAADLASEVARLEAEIDGLEVDAAITRISSVETLAEEVFERLTYQRMELDLLGTRVTDAGIYVDPSTGKVRIHAVAALEERVSTAEITVDALAAEIELRATYADVDQAISEALLDPTQIPIVDDLDVRLTTVETTLSAEQARIDSNVSALQVDGEYVTMTTVTSRLDGLDATILLKAEQADLDDVETRLNAAEIQIDVLEGASITQTVTDTRQQFLELDEDIQRNLGDLINRDLNEQAIRSATAAARQELTARVNDQFVAEAAARTLLEAEIAGVAADLVSEQLVRASEDEALASDIAQLQADLTSTNGSVSANATAISGLETRVAAAEGDISAQAADITALQSEITTLEGTVVANSGAISNLSTRVTAAEGNISANASDITSLEASLSSTNSNVSANASAISALDVRVTDNEGDISAQATQINSLTTRMGAAEADITSLETTKVDAAGAVAAAEAEISASYNSLTALATATSTAVARTNTLVARQYVGVVAGAQGASLELLAYDGVEGSGSQIALNADDVLVNGTLSANKLILDGQTVGVGAGGVLQVNDAGIDRAELAQEAASDLHAAYAAGVVTTSATDDMLFLTLPASTPDEAFIVNFYVEGTISGEGSFFVRYRRVEGDDWTSWFGLAGAEALGLSEWRVMAAGVIVGGGSWRTQFRLQVRHNGSSSSSFRNAHITVRSLKR